MIVGAGIFVLVGEVAREAGDGVGLAFLLAALAALPTGLSYASLASRHPRSAGEAVFLERAFLAELREAMQRELPAGDAETLEDHNRLVETVRDGNVFDGMRRSEVQEKIGRGQECGARDLCGRNGFRPDDWVYEIGQREGVAWGPTMIIGFDRQGIVDHVYTLTRR